MNIAIIGLTLSSSWGNGHATTYRSLVGALRERGHRVEFYERRDPRHTSNRDLPGDPGLHFYASATELLRVWGPTLCSADLLIVGSNVRDTQLIVEPLARETRGLLAYCDIDTPVTIANLRENRCSYLQRDLLPLFDLYLSFSGGSALDELGSLGALRPRPLTGTGRAEKLEAYIAECR